MAYTIQQGDTLSKIAQTNNTDVSSLLKLNPTVTDPNKIQAGGSLNLSAPSSTITSASLQNSGSPVIPPPTPDTNNYPGIISGVTSGVTSTTPTVPDTTYTDKSKSLLDSILKSTQDLTGKTAYEQSQLDASGATAIAKRQNELAGQITALNNENQAIPLQAQQDATGRGITTSGLQNSTITPALRANAIKALSINSEYALNAGNLETAKQTAQRAVDLKYGDLEASLDRNTKLLQLYTPFMNAEQQKIAEAKQAENEAKKTALTTNKQYQSDVINAAQASGQSNLASEALKLDPNSPTFILDLAKVQSRIVDTSGQLDIQLKKAQLAKAQVETQQARNTLPSAIQTKVQTVAGQFDGEQAVKQYQTIAESIDAVKSAGTSPTDDIQRIYAFAKVMDPNSAVKEGEYNTVQDYATTVLQRVGLKAKRVFDNSGFLTPEARKFINTTLDNRLASSEKAYKNIYSSYSDRINKITGRSDGKDYITDYSAAFNTKAPTNNDPLNLGIGSSKVTNPLGI